MFKQLEKDKNIHHSDSVAQKKNNLKRGANLKDNRLEPLKLHSEKSTSNPIQRIGGPKNGLWPNKLSGSYSSEQETAKRSGFKIHMEGSDEAKAIIDTGLIFKWVLRQDGFMRIGEDVVPHSILANNEDLETAGSGKLTKGVNGSPDILEITNFTGHYQTSIASVRAAKEWWEYYLFNAKNITAITFRGF